MSSQVDASNIYGETLETQHQLRLHQDGKLKYQVSTHFQSNLIQFKCRHNLGTMLYFD